MKSPLVEVVTESLVLLVPLVTAWLAAELRRRIQLKAVKRAVERVEDENWEECEAGKKARAVELVNRATGPLTRMNPEKVGRLVEKVLPKVQQANSSRNPSPNRRAVDVTFKE